MIDDRLTHHLDGEGRFVTDFGAITMPDGFIEALRLAGRPRQVDWMRRQRAMAEEDFTAGVELRTAPLDP